jgi:insulysin
MREMNAVEEEYRKNIESDSWRLHHVQKDLSFKQHPFSGFNTGNLETMKLIDQKYLKDWFKKHYSSNQMKLVIHGKESVPELELMALNYFGPVKNTGTIILSYQGPLYRPEILGKIVWIDPIKVNKCDDM